MLNLPEYKFHSSLSLHVLLDFAASIADPHVRIIGRKEDVLRVKDKVMAVLDAKVRQAR
jgi:hypothetical protein